MKIYDGNFYGKERKRAYMERTSGNRRVIGLSLFVAVLTFSLYMILQTLSESVLSSALPEFMQKSYFSVASLYVLLAYIVYTIYFAAYYEYLTFAEIRSNRWYFPVKLGFRPANMILAKLAARMLDVFILYTAGYVATVFMASFLKYPFVPAYLIQLYAAGMLDMMVIVMVCMTCSLFVDRLKTARWIVAALAVVMYVARITTGFYTILSDRAVMADFDSVALLLKNPYPWYGLAVAVICVVLCMVFARKKAMHESFRFYSRDHDYPKDVKLVIGKMRLEGSEEDVKHALRRNRVANAAVNVVLSLIILVMLAFNLLVLGMSLISPDNETSPIGVIPYVFQSNTMEPAIMFNDLALFETVDPVSPLGEGEVVLFKYGGEPYVARIKEITDSYIRTDIDYYPSTVKEEAYARNTTRGMIYARLVGTNRWIGALVLFANTTIGRLLMLLLPCMLIFFYKPITDFLSRISGGTQKERGNHGKSR